jgi:molybdenum cofactor cytidylyltransferase
MHLWEGLQVHKGEVISFVGAGGKTTAMYRLGRELAGLGWRVITTTTTMIRPPSPEETDALIVEGNPAQALLMAEEALRHKGLITVVSQPLETENKLKGVEPGQVAALAALADAVIVEADGAKGLSLKAPAAHEPVVPAGTTLLVPVVGVDAVGRRLAEGTVHRPELVARLTKVPLGETISGALLATLLVHPQGALKGTPADARVMPLINKVHDEAALVTAREIARRIKGNPSLERVLIGAVASDDPILECWRRVAAVVLAAGASRRFGQPKLILPVLGTTIIERVLNAVMATSVDEVVVVLGHSAAQIAERIPAGCKTVLNEAWKTGISSSIRAGLEAIDGSDGPSPGRGRVEALLFVLADQPQVKSEEIERVLQAYYGSMKPIVVPVYHGQRGTPALFDRSLFSALKNLRGDVGGRQLIGRFADRMLAVEMQSSDMFFDIDTPVAYEEFLERNRFET